VLERRRAQAGVTLGLSEDDFDLERGKALSGGHRMFPGMVFASLEAKDGKGQRYLHLTTLAMEGTLQRHRIPSAVRGKVGSGTSVD